MIDFLASSLRNAAKAIISDGLDFFFLLYQTCYLKKELYCPFDMEKMKGIIHFFLLWLGVCLVQVQGGFLNNIIRRQNDLTLLSTANFDITFITDSQVLASLKPKGSEFDFLPFDLIHLRSGDGQYRKLYASGVFFKNTTDVLLIQILEISPTAIVQRMRQLG